MNPPSGCVCSAPARCSGWQDPAQLEGDPDPRFPAKVTAENLLRSLLRPRSAHALFGIPCIHTFRFRAFLVDDLATARKQVLARTVMARAGALYCMGMKMPLGASGCSLLPSAA